jgi:catechol 2,3-dioxygenase-like lactoylglutathione lyase family enzyme
MTPYLAAISVSDLEASARWYEESLGFKALRRIDVPAHRVRIALLERDGFQLELVEHQDSKSPAALVPGIDNPALIQGFGKIAFRVRDIRRWESDLEARGVTFKFPLTESPADHSWSLIVADRDGNWVQLTEARE